MLAGGGSLAALWLLTLLGARLLVRPVRDLTRAAEEMASGDLERTVAVSEGGEIGVLAESLETMRAQLKDSLETVRRWGEELELKVADRTAELNARNRQLAAVSAILAAANETHDLDGDAPPLPRRRARADGDGRGGGAAARERRRGERARNGWEGFPCGSCTDDACLVSARPPCAADADWLRLSSRCAGRRPARRARRRTPERRRAGRRRSGRSSRRSATRSPSRSRTRASPPSCGGSRRSTRCSGCRSELISAVSHELRTPLGFIKGYATTLLRDDTPIEQATRRHFLEIIDEETDKLEHMIDELLDASRLQAGRLPIEREPVALARARRARGRQGAAGLEAGGHPVALRLPEDDVAVLADPLRIEQVLDNLLENAARYSDAASPVEVGLVAEDGHALLSVTDRGDGLPAAELEQIFEPFYRGPNAVSARGRGAGLGLAICRGIVEAHGGRIWGETGRDRATTFLVTLPLAA